MRDILEIIGNERIKQDFESNLDNLIAKMSCRKQLYQIENHFDLDNALEEMHSAKLSCDLMLNIIERIQMSIQQQLKRKKDELKEEKLTYSIAYENSLRKQGAFTTKEIDKRTEKYLIDHLRTKEEFIQNLNDDLDVCQFELNNYSRARESIDDIYMSLKKKYDLLIKRNLT